MLGRSSLPPGNVSIWRLHFRSARLYLSAGQQDDALRQTRVAFDGGTSDPPVGLLLAELLLNKGETSEARRVLDVAARKIAASDARGQELVRTYRVRIQAAAQ